MYPSEAHPVDGSFVHEQVESVRALGVEVDVYHIDAARASRWNYLSAFRELPKRLRRTGYDLLHSHHTYCMPAIAFSRSVLRHRIPAVLTFHESEFMKPRDVADQSADFIKDLVYSARLKRWALNQADMVIPVWSGLTRELGYNGPQVVLPCGIDFLRFQPRDRDECRREIGLPLDRPVVFFPAYIFDARTRRQFKGVDLFLESIQRVKESVPEVEVVTGGSIPRDRMSTYMNAADVIVQASLFEASPMVIKEAMAVGVPIVSFDVGDTAEIIGGTAGCYICERSPEDMATQIVKAIPHGRTTGRERLAELGLGEPQVAERLLDIYRECITGYGSST
jgi:glycosyltransferase involved in cell wall biosynthesis